MTVQEVEADAMRSVPMARFAGARGDRRGGGILGLPRASYLTGVNLPVDERERLALG